MIETPPGEWGWVPTGLHCAWEKKRKNAGSFKVARYAHCSPTVRTTPPFREPLLRSSKPYLLQLP